MTRSSIISHPPLMPMVIIRAEYRAICGADDNTAIVLNYFEHLTNAKFAIGNDPWIYKSIREMEMELLNSISGNTIRAAVDSLIDWGYLDQRRNPRSNIDKTWQYRLNIQIVQKHVTAFYNFLIREGSPITQFCGIDCSKLRNGLLKIEEAIPETTAKTTTKKKDFVPAMQDTQPDTPNPAPKQRPMYDAVFAVWGHIGGLNGDYQSFLLNKATKKQYKDCNVEPPVTPDELLSWNKWYRQRNMREGFIMLTSASKIQSSIAEYRRGLLPKTNTTPDDIDTPAPDTTSFQERLQANLRYSQMMQGGNDGDAG